MWSERRRLRASRLLTRIATVNQIFDLQRDSRRFDDLFERDWRAAACRDRVAKTTELFKMSLVDVAAPQRRLVARFRQLLEVVDDVRVALAEHRDVFFAEAFLRPERRVQQRRH